jgi:hypothetical protein
MGGTAAANAAAIVSGGQQQLTLNYPPKATAGSGVSLTCRYWRSAGSAEMAADTDVPIFPIQYHNLIVSKALAIALNRYGLAQDAVAHERDYQEQLQVATSPTTPTASPTSSRSRCARCRSWTTAGFNRSRGPNVPTRSQVVQALTTAAMAGVMRDDLEPAPRGAV